MKTQGCSEALKNNYSRHIHEKNSIFVLTGKKKEHGSITFYLANKCIVIGHTKEGCQQGSVNKGLGKVTEYLKDTGF